MIFFISLAGAAGFLQLERAMGIEWDFHPDAATYTLEYLSYTSGGFLELPNNLYFFVSEAVEGEPEALIAINVLLFALCNCLAYPTKAEVRDSRQIAGLPIAIWLFLLFVAQPYRWHLAVHGLKDTLIIFLVLLCIRARWSSLAALPILLLTRLAAVFYVLMAIPRRFFLAGFVFGMIFLVLTPDAMNWLFLRNEVDMGGREFDAGPTFADLGELGALLRAASWPILLLSGAFVLLSPSWSFLPIAVEMVAQRIGAYCLGKSDARWLQLLATLAIIALLVTSFTSFIRYSYPVICVLPVWALAHKRSLQRAETRPFAARQRRRLGPFSKTKST